MASQRNLQLMKEQLEAKKVQLEAFEHDISSLALKIHKLSQKFQKENAKIQHKIDKVQFSRPRGNPANQCPHSPMTIRVRAFYQIKERKETELRQNQDLLRQTFHHNRAILTTQKNVLQNSQSDIESQIRLLNIQLH